jgi:UPF0755 protein
VRQRDRESVTDFDPHGLFFDQSDDDADERHTDSLPVVRISRADRRRHAARRRNRRVIAAMAVVLAAAIGIAIWLVVLPVYHYFSPSDYSGNGAGTVVVEVHANDNAQAIGETLKKDDVVASVRAFTDAAKQNSKSQNIQPGSYRLHKHMAAKNALALMLNPAARVNSDVVVTEGATTLDVLKRLTAPSCKNATTPGAVCGAGMSKAAVTKALEDVAALGLPTDFTIDGKLPPSVEGFLYPATYYFPDKTTPSAAIQTMVTQFTEKARSTSFTAQAKALHITPYQELIIASIAQSEAKFPDDMAKVARVILNRLAAPMPLQIDATSAYAAKLKGLDPSKVIYAEQSGPYNTYRHDGLPPTPISNPGAEAMNAAAHPASGNWLYYVNADAAGHLFFTNSEAAFSRAVAKCKANNWGCG